MAKLVVGSRAFDMSSWDLSDIGGGTVTTDTASEVDVTGAGATFVYQIKGSGFTTFDTNGFPTDGTVTGLTMTVPGKTPLVISGVSISATDFMGFVNSHDTSGLETAIFAGNDGFTGRAGDDVLLGFAGNDTFNLTKGGDDTANGGDGNDRFNMGAAFTANDHIDGGTGSDTLELNGDYSTEVFFGGTTMANVETMILAKGHDYKLGFSGNEDPTGHSLNVTASGLTSANKVTLDGSTIDGTLRLVGGGGNDHLFGGMGDNTLAGGAGNDTFISEGGTNNVSGGDGDDAMNFFTWSNTGDFANGGDGNDLIVLSGSTSDFTGAVFDKTDMKSVENITMLAGASFDIAVDTSGFKPPAGDTLRYTVDASMLGASDSLTLDALPGTDHAISVIGGAGDDTITVDGSKGGSVGFDATQGGDDTITSSTVGSFGVSYGATLTSADIATGAARLLLNGDYPSLTFNAASTFSGLTLEGNHNYDITVADANAPTGLNVDAGEVGSSDSLTLDASALTHSVSVTSTAGHDTITTGSGDDSVTSQVSLDATISTGDGDDGILVNNFNANDSVDGGAGNDSLALVGTIGTITVTSAMIQNVETLVIGAANTGIRMTVGDNIVASGETLTVKAGFGMHFDGSAETTGSFDLIAQGGHPVFIGSQNADTMQAIGGGSTMTGEGGADILIADTGRQVDSFVYLAVSDSTSTGYDTIENFAALSNGSHAPDNLDFTFTVSGVDAAVTTGALSTASFDTDLAAAVGAGQLAAGHAVVFTASSGTLTGDHFLIVDANGTAGYQAGADYVILMDNASDLGSLSTANFI